MTKTLVYITLFLFTFSSCSDEIIAVDQIAGNYSNGILSCHEMDIEDNYENVQVTYFPDCGIEIDLGSTTGILEGVIFDNAEIEMGTYQGLSLSGKALDFPAGSGDFYSAEMENGNLNSVHINFHTLENRVNICRLTLNDF